jgi:hypothetical protein
MTRRPKCVTRVEIARAANGEPSWTIRVEGATADEALRLAVEMDADLQRRLAQTVAPASTRLH